MNKYLLTAFAAGLAFVAGTANAALIGVYGNAAAGDIIAAPSDVTDDAYTNRRIEAFNEKQNVLLTEDLLVDGGFVAKGTRVDSHMIMLNTEGKTGAEWADFGFIFSGNIVGIMSDVGGTLEAASSGILGAMLTTYPSAFNLRGLEGNPEDSAVIDGGDMSRILVGMKVSEPGDWIRVVTVSAVPVPASMLMLTTALAGIGGVSALRRRRKA